MNKSYLNLLVRQHRTLLIFLLLVEAAFSMMPFINTSRDAEILQHAGETGLTIGIVLSILIAAVMPMMLFSYIHRKSSVDLYFALPISRRQLLVTGILFCWLAAFGGFAVSSVVVFAAGDLSVTYLLSRLLWAAYSLLAVILFVTFVYTIANNIFDGFVLVCAYSLLPVAILMAVNAFCAAMVAGNNLALSFRLAGYLSPSVLCLQGVMYSIHLRSAVILFVFGVISCIGLRHEFIKRKAERAQQISSGFLAYPLVIHLYALLSMAFLIFSFYREVYNGMYVLFFLVLFVIYIIATAVYKRTIRISWKPVLIFAVMLACCAGFASAGWHTQGFGLAQNYSVTEGDSLVYEYYYAVSKNDGMYSLNIRLIVPSKGGVKRTQAVRIMETLRQNAISDFYSRRDEYNGSGNLLIYNTTGTASAGSDTFEDEGDDLMTNSTNDHNYNLLEGTGILSADDIKVLQAAGATVEVSDDEGNDVSVADFLAMK